VLGGGGGEAIDDDDATSFLRLDEACGKAGTARGRFDWTWMSSLGEVVGEEGRDLAGERDGGGRTDGNEVGERNGGRMGGGGGGEGTDGEDDDATSFSFDSSVVVDAIFFVRSEEACEKAGTIRGRFG